MASSLAILKLSRSLSKLAGLSRSRSIMSSSIALKAEGSESESNGAEYNSEASEQSDHETLIKEGENDSSTYNATRKFPFREDAGIYKAILVGEVGQRPVQKTLKSGRVVTMFSVGTGGMRNNRRPLENESPKEYAERSMVQWHRVAIYGGPLGNIAMEHLKPGDHVYLEGSLEMKVYNDAITGLVRRYREVALRREGRLIMLNGNSGASRTSGESLRGVGYF